VNGVNRAFGSRKSVLLPVLLPREAFMLISPVFLPVLRAVRAPKPLQFKHIALTELGSYSTRSDGWQRSHLIQSRMEEWDLQT
jgi:hypothetical protein